MHVVMVREDFDTGDTELAIFERSFNDFARALIRKIT
jgi:hypothetical protein